MKLSEKIYSCRKKAGLSQEALAEKLSVSRQAVSKWETGEAIPELSKIPAMAKIFGVTADWLLSEEDDNQERAKAEEAPFEATNTEYHQPSSVPSWVDNLPSTLGNLFKRFGWLIGVYIAVIGGFIALFGAVILFLTTHATNTVEQFDGEFYEFINEGFYFERNEQGGLVYESAQQ